MTDLKKLGALLHRKHKKSGKAISNDARRAEIQKHQLRNVFEGSTGATFTTIEKACNHFGVTIKFFDGDKELIL